VVKLVRHFYKRILNHQEIAPFFNEYIDNWPLHKERFTDFWYSNLFSTKTYKGKTLNTHKAVDNHFENGLNSYHFHIWLEIWNQTINNFFAGEKAELAKKRANGMAHCMCNKLMAHKVQENKMAS
jgi:hemoglobin